MKKQTLPYLYALATVACTFAVGQLILWLSPDGADVLASVLFILMNLLPMLAAFVFVRISGEITGTARMLRASFTLRERWYAYAAALAVPLVYYGVSFLLGNVTFTGSPFSALLAYFPWTLLQGGLEEVGWRWYLQTHISVRKSFVLKMLVISLIWFVWHFPIYRLPWITAGSSDYLVFYLMILGNTFTLGAVKELSYADRYYCGLHACREQSGQGRRTYRRGNRAFPACRADIGRRAEDSGGGLWTSLRL